MIPNIIRLQEKVRELQERLDNQEMKFDLLATQVEHLILTTTMAHAHVENLIERVAELENPSPLIPCTCGWGGEHDPDNPRCDRNKP